MTDSPDRLDPHAPLDLEPIKVRIGRNYAGILPTVTERKVRRQDAEALLAEVERLRAALAAPAEPQPREQALLEAFALLMESSYRQEYGDDVTCLHCGVVVRVPKGTARRFEHDAMCPVRSADTAIRDYHFTEPVPLPQHGYYKGATAKEQQGFDAGFRAGRRERHDAAPVCVWTEESDGEFWQSGCGETWVFLEGGSPSEHRAHFCHACGKPIQAVPFVAPVDDDEEAEVPAALRVGEPPVAAPAPSLGWVGGCSCTDLRTNGHGVVRDPDPTCPVHGRPLPAAETPRQEK